MAAGCSDDVTPVVDGDVSIRLIIAGGAYDAASRAETTEPGDDALNENDIHRIDLYVFAGADDDDALTAHRWWASGKGFGTYTQTEDNGVVTGVWNNLGLAYQNDALAGKTIYIVTNDDAADSRSMATVGDLRACAVGDATFDGFAVQYSFVMDGSVKDIGSTVEQGTDANGLALYTIPVEIARAAAKIRLHILRSYDGGTTTEDLTTSSNMNYLFVNCAADAALVADGDDISGTVTLVSDGLVAASDAVAQIVDGDTTAVFYSYPNDWFDAAADIRQTEPIDDTRQTYVMILLPYMLSNGTEELFWYKVPVNYRLQDDNDDPAAEPDRDLYRLQRNHIYDITALVDRTGGTFSQPGTVTVTTSLKYQATEWGDKGGDITFN